jgi:flagellar protein FlbD
VFILLSRGTFYSALKKDRGPIMIALTRLNGQQFVINAEKIRYVESTPDTMVCCDTGEKMMVKESLAEVMKRAIEYARVVRRPITD